MTKSLYQRLLPEIKVNLNTNSRRYASAKRLKYRLMSKIAWYELSIEDVRSLQTWADIYDRSVDSVLYGDNIINKD
tara:strand:- start:907 stop:1134 length:228 start_codon:yes stop_codon:yes gene_type:complete